MACVLGCSTVALTSDGTASYHAYGDSITAGATLASPAYAYPSLIAKDKSVTLDSYANSGDQACDIPTRQIFSHSDNPVAPYPLYTLMIGTNDADKKGSGAYEAVFNLCHQAAIAWIAIPASDKVLASSPAVTSTGSGSLDSRNNWNAWRTTSAGSSVTFPIKLAASSPIYAWPRIIDEDAGAFTYALDGQILGTLTTATAPAIATQNGSNNSLAFLRIPRVPAGVHTVTFTQTSASGSMEIVAIGAPPAASTNLLPAVIVGDVPMQKSGTQAPCIVTPAICAAYTADIQANIALLAGDGLRIVYADNHSYMHGTAAEMDDELHPNDVGQAELHEAFEAVYR
jgi:lysophospholipase L1-like esterase